MLGIQPISYIHQKYQSNINNTKANLQNKIQINNNYQHSNINFCGWFWNKSKPEMKADNSAYGLLKNTRNYTPHIICGGLGNVIACYNCGNKSIFSKLRKNGKIDTLIYLGENAAINSEMQKSIQKAGLKHFVLSVWGFDNWFNYDKNNNKISVKQEAVDKLKTFFEIMNSKDNIVIGCDEGKQRTSFVLFLNYFFNKQKQQGEQVVKSCIKVSPYTILDNYIKSKELFNALSPKQKEELGIENRKIPEIDMTDIESATNSLKEFFLANN